MSKALELAKFGRETPPAGVVVGDTDLQTLSQKTFADGPVFSSGAVNAVPYLNASKVFSTSGTFVFDGTNLGIGTANPAYKLQLKDGAIGVTSADGTVTSIINYNSLGTVTNSDFVFNTNSTERARISSSGLAVTGALSTTGNVSVSSTNPTLTFTRTDNGTTPAASINFSATSTVKWQIATNQAIGPGLEFNAGNGTSNLLYLTTAGNLGIGNSAPTAKLHIKGTEYAQYIETASTTNNDAIRLALVAPGAQSQVELEWWNDSTKTGGGYGLIQTGKSLNSPNFNFMVAKVGIGTTDPQDKLHVVGAIRSLSGTTGTLYLGASTGGTLYPAAALVGTPSTLYAPIGRLSFQLPTHGVNTDYGLTEQMFIEGTGSDSRGAYKLVMLPHGGNVGIGTYTPSYSLEVVSPVGIDTPLTIRRDAWQAGEVRLNLALKYAISGYISSGISEFVTDTGYIALNYKSGSATYAEGLRVSNLGRVGIGTPIPNEKLTVWTTSATGLQTALRLNNPFGFANQNTGTQIVFSQDRSTAEDLKQGIIAVGQNDPGTSATSYMSFSTNNTGLAERLRIDHVGRIIINPNQSSNYPAMLDIYGGGGASTLGAIRIGDGTYASGHVNYWDIGRDNNISGDFTFSLNASEKMRIKTNGNLAIGTTTNTDQKLNVNGSLWLLANDYASYSTIIAPRLDSTHPFTIQTRNNDSTMVNWLGIYAGDAGVNNRIVLGAGGWPVVIGGTTSARASSKLDIRGDIMTLGSNGSYYATIDYNAGLGLLSLAAESGGGISFKSGTAERLRIAANGTLISAQHQIRSYVNSGTLHQFTIESSSQTNGGYLKILNDGAVGGVRGIRLGVHGNGSTPDSGNTDVLVVTDSARVGIGTTSPDAKLTVANNGQSIGTQQTGNGADQGTAQFLRVVKLCPSVSSNNKLIIPFVSQGSLNSNTVCRVMGHNAAYNTSAPQGFEITFAVGHLNAMYSFSYWGAGGNAVSAAVVGQTVEITFSSSYNIAYATSGGVFITLEYMTNYQNFSIDVPNVRLN